MRKKLLVAGFLLLGLGRALVPVSAADDPMDENGVEPPVHAVVTVVDQQANEDGTTGALYTVRFTDGPARGQTVQIGDNESIASLGGTIYAVGEKVLVSSIDHVDGTERFIIVDRERRPALWLIAGLFVAVVIWFSRWRGVRSLIGLVFTYIVIIYWIVPRLAAGHAAVPTAVIGGAAILLGTLLVTEGWTRGMLASAVSMVSAMGIILLLSQWAASFSRLTGLSGEEAFYLSGSGPGAIDLRGLLLASILLGTLGLLDDVAVAQVATVGELRRANDRQSKRSVYQAAMRIGRSHLSAIVNTLILAYAGTALPLLVLFNLSGSDTSTVLNGELVATEIVRSFIGSIGLVLAMPIATLVAVWFNVTSKHPIEAGHIH